MRSRTSCSLGPAPSRPVRGTSSSPRGSTGTTKRRAWPGPAARASRPATRTSELRPPSKETRPPPALQRPPLGTTPRFGGQVEPSRLFPEAMPGAVILYNLMLSEERRNAQWIEEYRARFEAWGALVQHRAEVFGSWKRPDFWSLVDSARVTLRMRRFVNGWLDLALTT